MVHDAFGLIYTGEANAQLRELTFSRSVAAVPFGGRYRAIDFVLSNIVNTGISNVGVIAQRNYHSLIDHLGSGKEWDLHRKRDGLFILPPFVTKDNPGVYRGTVDAIRSVLGFIRRSQKYVILTGSHTIYNTTFDDMLDQHIKTNAEITIMYSDETNTEPIGTEQYDDLRLSVDESGRVTELTFNYPNAKTKLTGCDAYIMAKDRLEYLVEEAAAHGEYDFMQGVLVRNLGKCAIYGYKYDGYVARLNSVLHYYKHNLDLLNPKVAEDLFNPAHPIYTKVKDEFPASYVGNGKAKNSIIADGCIIEGEVEGSVLFRGVHVHEGAKITDSIIMQASDIEDGSKLSCMILDKNCRIASDRCFSGSKDYPMIMRKNTKA